MLKSFAQDKWRDGAEFFFHSGAGVLVIDAVQQYGVLSQQP
jgi:hypothetical protein